MRKEQISLLVILAFTAIAGCYLIHREINHIQEDFTITQNTNYTFYQVEIEWPGSVCKFNNCTSQYMGNFDGSTFNLHGVWPTGQPTNQCQYDNFCQTIPFDNSLLIDEVQDALNTYWVGLYNPTETFHQHEWEKHGVCWNDNVEIDNEELTVKKYTNDYFALGVNIVNLFNPLPLWDIVDIRPSNSKSYDYELAMATLRPIFGQGVVGQCSIVGGQQLLHSLDFCLGLDYIPIDCPCAKAKKSSCKADQPIFLGEFVYPQ